MIIRERIQKKPHCGSVFREFSLFNSAVADMVYKPVEQPVEPVKPDLKIESVNEKFAEKYPNQYNSWRSTGCSNGL